MDNPRVNPLSHDGRAPSLAYNSALDGLRGVAILLVILSHAHAPLFDGAFYGVDLFFVLSGFLITSLLLQELQSNGRLDYWRFYRRRFFRLMPALALFLGAYCVFAPLLWPDLTDVYSDALVSLLYLADYGIAFFDSPDTLLHMWSLSVEEHFYLVWPPLLVVLARFTPRGALWRPVLGLLVQLSTVIVFGSVAFLGGALAPRVNSSPRAQVWINRLAGCIFAGLAVFLLCAQRA